MTAGTPVDWLDSDPVFSDIAANNGVIALVGSDSASGGSDVLCLSGPTLGFTQLSQSEGYFNACVVDPSNGNVYVGGANDSGGVLWAFSSADGSLLWMQNESFDGAFDNIVAANNNIYAFGDDIRIFNSSGTLTDTIAQSTNGVFPQSNGQIIYMTSGGVERLNSDESTDTTFGDAGTFPASLPYGSYEGFYNLTQLDDGGFASVGGGSDGSTLTVLNFANGSGLGVSSVSPQGSSITATPGASFAGRVATFTDENSSYNSTGDFTASIDWGDGSSPTTGTIESDGTGGFIVNGTHTYSAGGDYQPVVSITPPDVVPGVVYSDAEVSSVSLSGVDGSATAGNVFTGQIAAFTDSVSGEAYTASAALGDGTDTIPTTVSHVSGDTWEVSISQTFTDPDSIDASVTVTASNGSTESVDSAITVSDAALSASPVIFQATAGSDYNGTVATFSYPDGSATADQFQASIDWGDGNIADGVITSSGDGTYSVSGDNTFGTPGTDYPAVTIYDPFGGTAIVTDTALVYTGAPPANVPGASTATEGASYPLFFAPIAPTSGTVAAWTIDWGDSTLADTIAGTQSFDAHTFASGTASSIVTYTARNSSGTTLTSGTWDVTVNPAAPTGVSAAWEADGTDVDLSWSESSAIAGTYTVEESVNGTPFTSVETISGTSTTIDNLDPTGAYAFEVTANDSSGSASASASGNLDPFDSGGDGTPHAPTMDGTAVSSSEIDLTFTDPPTDGSHLELEELGPDDENFHTIPMPSAVEDEPGTYAVTGLDPDTMYEFKLRADLNGKIAYGTTVEESTEGDESSGFLNAAFSNSDEGFGNVEVDWSGASAEDVSVEARFDIGGGLMAEWPENPAINYVSSGGSSDYTGYISISPGVQYQLRLTDDNGDKSGWTTVDTASSDRPAPTGLTATPDGTNVTLSWSYSGDVSGTLFDVVKFQYHPGNNTLETLGNGDPADQIQGATSCSESASPNLVYIVIASANYGGGFFIDASAPSNAAMGSGAAVGATPATPQNLKAYVTGQSTVRLVWDNTPNNEDGFYVQEKLDSDPDSAWTTVDSVGQDIPTDLSVTLTGGQISEWVRKHDFRAEAYNGFGTSQPSNVATQSGVALEAASFDATAPVVVRHDQSSGSYSGAQYVDDSLEGPVYMEGLGTQYNDGTVPGTADEHEYPIATSRSLPGEPEYLNVNLGFAFNGSVSGDWLIQGSGGGFDFWGSVIGADRDGMISANLTGSGVPETINFEELSITWQISVDGGQHYFDVGSSDNPLFVTGAAVSTAYETVLWIGGQAAHDLEPHNPGDTGSEVTESDDPVINAIMGAFGTAGPMNPVEAGNTPLAYWGLIDGVPPANFDTASLLQSGSGRCGAWADFLVTILTVEGVSGANVCNIELSAAAKRSILRNVPAYARWPYNNQPAIRGVVYPALPGQNNTQPQNEFDTPGFHAVVTISDITEIFDPSYGKTYTGASRAVVEQNWLDAALKGWRVFTNLATGANVFFPHVRGTIDATFSTWP